MATATPIIELADHVPSDTVPAGGPLPVRLQGVPLTLARAYVASIAVLSVFFLVRRIPGALHTIDDETPGFPPPETIRRGLEQLHISEALFEVAPFVLTALITLIVFSLAALLLVRRSDELAPLAVALFFIAGRGASFPPDIAPMWETNPPLAFAASLVTLTWICTFYWLFLLFPNGRLEPRWTAIPGVVFVSLGIWWFFISPNADAVTNASDLLVLPLVLSSALYAQVHRWRHTPKGEARQQMKWATLGLVTALSVFVLLNLLLGIHDWEGESNAPVAALGTLFFFVTVEVATGLVVAAAFSAAILRYRLYDVDIFVSRALVYACLTAMLAVTYFAVVVALNRGLNAGLGLASPVGLAAGVILFEPLRRRLQTGTNRVMFGLRDEPYAVLASLGRQLDDTLHPERVPETVASVVASSLRLPWVAVYLEQDDLFVAVAECGTRSNAVDERFEVGHSGRVIGLLAIQPRLGEKQLGDRDRRLIEDLCRQSGPALASLRLTDELQRSRERLVSAREEERRRLRRDLHDGIGPRLAGIALRVEMARDLAEDNPEIRGSLDDLANRLQEAVADIRRLVYGLRPPALDDLGLVGALRQIIERDDPTGSRVSLDVAGTLPPLSAAVEAATFRIVQEALTNVVRHAPSAMATVELSHDPEASLLLVTVSDDGEGATCDAVPGIGMHSMRERAEELGGSFEFESSSRGATVRVRLPLRGIAAAGQQFRRANDLSPVSVRSAEQRHHASPETA